ncbi:hypothetical protein GH5_03206 [Leishmania sp. Ghana 2012 LV757]|uniref:hypothetical protein n=1 Tax=Leishmania sp. Ghana 2012 LV757 TaxID=2803181 RepID=UPI001B7B7738|nr:hypothetical protein GH5_03206 [Leishmania sp. Ghana 2012 LV757]
MEPSTAPDSISRTLDSAEELYGLVCALQKEQQLTQVELRAVQRRTDALQQELHRQQTTVSDEQARQEELTEHLAQGYAERRLAEAHARGAARASDDAARELRLERRAFVRKCHCYALSLENAPTDAGLSDLPLALSTYTRLFSAEDESCSGTVSAETVGARRVASLMSPAAVHRLLLLLKTKLTRCMEVGATTAPGPIRAPLQVTPITEGTSNEQPLGRITPAEQCAAATVGPAVVASVLAGICPHRPPSPSIATGSVCDAADGQSSSREKKRIGFAPVSCFERVTAVPAANVNRGTRQIGPTGGSTLACSSAAAAPPCANMEADGDSIPPPTYLKNGPLPRTQRFGGNFTVRVASRSAMLLAEAAALGAKRQRASEAARVTHSSPPKAARVDGVEGGFACSAPHNASATPALAPACTKDRGCIVVPADLLLPLSAEARRNASSGPGRRTVWTWTRGTPPKE